VDSLKPYSKPADSIFWPALIASESAGILNF